MQIKDIILKSSSGITPSKENKKFWETQDIPWLRSEFVGQYYIYDTPDKISKYALNNTTIKLCKKDTVVVALYGESRGRVSIIKQPMTMNQACLNLEVDKTKCNLHFLYYWLKLNFNNLRRLGSGVQTNLNSQNILEFSFPEIELETQDKIAEILSGIDDQIARNDAMTKKLQVLAQAIYSRWFNQFEFPNNDEKLVFNEQLGKNVPKSWSILSLSDCVSLNMRGISQVEEPNKQIVPVVNQKCIRNGNVLMSEVYWHNNDNCLSTYQLSFMDVLVNSMGTGTLGRISPFVIDKICVPHSCVTVLRINESTIISKSYLYLTIKQMEQKITSMGMGSTGQTSLNNSELGKIKIVVPPIDIQSKFELCILPLFEQLQRINMENINLFTLKRTMIPLLINGQLNI